MKSVVSLVQGCRPSSVEILLYDSHNSFRVAPISSRPVIFLITFRPRERISMFFKAGREIILSMQFVLRAKCLTLTSWFNEESIFSIGGLKHRSLTTSASSGLALSFFSDHSWIAFWQFVPGMAVAGTGGVWRRRRGR